MRFELEDMGIRADSDIIQIKQTAGGGSNPLIYCKGVVHRPRNRSLTGGNNSLQSAVWFISLFEPLPGLLRSTFKTYGNHFGNPFLLHGNAEKNVGKFHAFLFMGYHNNL